MGGTGKTPMIELLIRMLAKENRIAVLSRGYKRQSEGFQLANSNSTVLELGDEPYQIHEKFPDITVAVDADRRNGIKRLETEVKPDIILLDDAFQHRKVKPDFNILLTSFDNQYITDWFLPTGNLRDAKQQARRADIIVVTKCPADLSNLATEQLIKKIKIIAGQKVLFSTLEYNNILQGQQKELELNDFKDAKFTLVTGIANPEPLISYLRSKGLDFEHLAYRDHHFFSEKEIRELRKKSTILTTEKDFVRLGGQFENIFYIAIKHTFLFDGQTILENEMKGFTK